MLHDTPIPHRFARFDTAALVAVAASSSVVISAWLVPALEGVLPAGWQVMKFNTACSLVIAAAALALARQPDHAWRRAGSRAAATVVLLVGSVTLAQYATGQSFGIDTWVVDDPGPPFPGRMAVQTASFLVLLGLVLLLHEAVGRFASALTDTLVIVLAMLPLIVTHGYLFGAVELFGQSPAQRTAPLTLLSMAALTIVVFLRRSTHGIFAVLAGSTRAGEMARTMLPLLVLTPFVLASSAAFLVSTGTLSPAYVAAFTASISVIILLLFTILMAWMITDLEQELVDMSLTDTLTAVSNRRGFYVLGMQAFRQARRARKPFTVIFFDIDDLKEINDTHGHSAGSELLAGFGTLVRAAFRTTDVVARVGGDEFAVACQSAEADLSLPLDRLTQAIAHANHAAGRPYHLKVSMGVATCVPPSVELFDELVERADAAMYGAKRQKLPPQLRAV